MNLYVLIVLEKLNLFQNNSTVFFRGIVLHRKLIKKIKFIKELFRGIIPWKNSVGLD